MVSTLFPVDVSVLWNAYELVAPSPSLLDFFQWFATLTSGQVNVLISSNQLVLVVDIRVTTKLQSGTTNLASSSSLQQINNNITNLAGAIKSKYPSTSDYNSPSLSESTFTGWQCVRLT